MAVALSPAVAKPAHVPASRVYDFDLFLDPGIITDPHKRIIARMPTFRLDPAHPPVFHGGHVIELDALHIVWDV